MPRQAGRHASRGRGAEVVKGLSSLVGLLVVAVGVPVVLWRIIGWPLPHALPSLDELRDALTGPTIPDEVFPKALALVAWLVWAQFVASLAAEAAASLRGTMPRRIPGAGWGLQAAAARLVATVLLLLPSPLLVRPVAASPLSVHPAPVVRAWGAAPSGQAADGPSSSSPAAVADLQPAASQHPKRVVERHDTLWAIAQRHLGDPRRWPEIFQLNKDRPLPDPPGGRFTNPDRIYPGQVLLMPADATGLPASQDRASGGPGTENTQPQGDRNAAAAPPPPSTTAPTTTVPTTTVPTITVPTTTVPATTVPATTTEAGEPASRPGARDTAVPVGPAVGVGGLLAVGVLLTLARLRRRQQRHRRPGRRIRLPLGREAHVEEQLRAAAEPEWARFLDAALRTMAAGLRRTSLPPPTIQAVLLGHTELEILLAEPSEAAPPPFTLGPDGRRWTLPCHIPVTHLEALGSEAVAPLPGLVTLGFGDTGQLMVNLEAPGLTALVGDPTATRPVLDAMAVELATAASSGFVQVLLVGFGPELDRLERVHRAEHLEDVLPDLERQAQEAAELVDDTHVGSVLGGRIAGDGADSWSPTVVLVAQPPDPPSLERLATLTGNPRRSTVAAVLLGDAPQADWHLEVDDDHVRVPALDLKVRPQRLAADDYAAIGALLSTAGDLDGVDPTAPPYDELQPTTPATPPEVVTELQAGRAAGARLAAATFAGSEPAEATVDVRVLGRVEVHGARKIERAKSIELIVYLALHPQGVDSDKLWEALWPERPLNRGTLHTTVTAARTGLGRAPDGARYLPDASGGEYRLSDAVGLDWARFQVLAAHGRSGAPDDTQALRQALELVRGLPLESPTSRAYEWAVVHRTEMETVVAETAERLGQLCLDADDPEQANWAARRGLSASPYDERLYRVLMRAAHAAGNSAGVETVWKELLAVLGADIDLVDEDLHPETVALYSTLRPSGRARTGQPGPRGRRTIVSPN
jgi:DNA-binding SARP family transcriptional activator